MTLFDLVALCILAVSTIVGVIRGALREVITVIAFVLAGVIAIAALKFVGPIARAALKPPWLGNVTALFVVFLSAYILLRVIGSAVSRGVRRTEGLGTIDRAVGGAFGLGRGLFTLGLANLALHLIPMPNGLPIWISGARLYPLSEVCATAARWVAPRGSGLARRLTPAIENAVNADGATSPQSGQDPTGGYDHAARKGLDDAMEQTR